MALLARTLRRSRLCSMTSVRHWIPTATTRSSDIWAGLARAEPDLPPPQELSCMLEGPAMFRSCLGSGGVRAFSNRVASKSSEHIVGGIQLKTKAFQNSMESVGSNLRNINVGFPSKSQSSSLWRTSTSPEIMGNALCTKSASGLIMQTPEIRGYNFSTCSQSGSGDVPSHHPGERLLPVNQLNFLNCKEMWYEEWVTPIVYLRKKRLYHEILTSEPERVKPLVEQFFRDLARSLVRLVACNRVRGYDISDSLHIDNLLVSPKHNAFALKKVIWSYTSKPEEFTGYQAAGRVLKEILDSVYYSGVIENLSADVGYLFTVRQDVPR